MPQPNQPEYYPEPSLENGGYKMLNIIMCAGLKAGREYENTDRSADPVHPRTEGASYLYHSADSGNPPLLSAIGQHESVLRLENVLRFLREFRPTGFAVAS